MVAKDVLKKGDRIVDTSTGWVGTIEDNLTNRKTRMVKIFGVAEEMGSAYAENLRKVTDDEFERIKEKTFMEFGGDQWTAEEQAKMKARLKRVI